jgi:sugar phosphate isomerase/epimerase
MAEMSRRAWLGQVGAGAFGLAASPLLAAAPAKAAVSFGFSLYGMRSLKLAEAVRLCAKIGYDGVELAVMPGWPADPKGLSKDGRRDLRKQMGDAGLKLAGLMENLPALVPDAGHRKNLGRLAAAAELGHDVSGGAPVIETILGGKPAEWEKSKGRLAERLGDWARVAKRADCILAVKPHVSGMLHTPEGALWLWRQVDDPRVKLVYDYSHFELRGFRLAESMKALVPHAVFIHVKDSKGDAKKVQFLLPGDGKVDYGEYFTLLKGLGYSGPVVVEVSGQIHGKAGYDPEAAARRSYANLAPALKKAGLRPVRS